jgi:lipid II:glycine glycyltransferase (peptidoglycan interpeptide bridge formation enzyme)
LPIKEKVDFDGFIGDFKSFFGINARIQFHSCIMQNYRGQTPILSGSDPDSFERSTFLIEDFSRKTAQNLWGAFRKTLGQEIKKSEQHNIVVEELGGEDELKKFYNLYLDTIKRHKTIPLPFSIIKFLSAHAKIFLAKRDGAVIGGSVFLLYKPFIHYFINASDFRFRELNIGHKILWHVMQLYAGKDYDYFDLGGTRKGSALETFKRGWGAKEYPIYEIGQRGTSQPALWKRDLWAVIPGFLAKRAARYALYWLV